MTRLYVPAELDHIQQLLDGRSVLPAAAVEAISDDELDEHEALYAAAEAGTAVITVEVTDATEEFSLQHVQAIHLDIDDSGDLAWFAPSEAADVAEILKQL